MALELSVHAAAAPPAQRPWAALAASGSGIAQREGLRHSTVNEQLRHTLLEPAIFQAILAGKQARRMSLLGFSGHWPDAELVDTMLALRSRPSDRYIRWYHEARIKISQDSRSPVEHRRRLGIAASPVQVSRRTCQPGQVGQIDSGVDTLP